MAGNIQNVSFASPQALIAPDIAAQQQQVARNQQLADALRSQSLQDIPGNGGAVSWTQGVSKLASALAAKRLYQKADTQEADMSRQYVARLREMVTPSAAPVGNPALAASVRAAAGVPQPAQVANPAYGSGGVDDDGNQSPTMPTPQPPSSASAPAPTGASAAGASAPSPPPQFGQMGSWSLSGNPNQDIADWALNSEEYSKALIASHSPVDMAKTITQARDAMTRGDMATAHALLASVDKQNYIAPLSGRPGATIRDARDPSKVIGYDAPSIDGAVPIYGQDGQFQGYKAAPGAAQITGDMTAAKARAGIAGNLVQTWNPQTGQMEYTPQSQVLDGSGGGGAGPAPGALNSMFGGRGAGGGRFAAGAPQGSGAAADAMGKASGQGFANLAESASDAPNRIYALKQMQQIASDPRVVLGPGSATAAHIAGAISTVSQSFGLPVSLNANTVTNVAEFNKWASQYGARAAQDLGLGGSDARMNMTVAATPNGHMTNAALQSVIPQMIGFENARQGMANAGAQYAQQRGAASYPQFLQAWRANYDPRIYTAMAQGPQAVKRLLSTLSPADRQQLIAKSNTLAQIGALPQ